MYLEVAITITKSVDKYNFEGRVFKLSYNLVVPINSWFIAGIVANKLVTRRLNRRVSNSILYI